MSFLYRPTPHLRCVSRDATRARRIAPHESLFLSHNRGIYRVDSLIGEAHPKVVRDAGSRQLYREADAAIRHRQRIVERAVAVINQHQFLTLITTSVIARDVGQLKAIEVERRPKNCP